MRILIEHGGYPVTNMGDLAMLQVAVERVKKSWDNVQIEVFSSAPDKLEKFCPNVYNLPSSSQQNWFHPLAKTHRLIPSSLSQHLSEFEWWFRHHSPSLSESLIYLKLKARRAETSHFESFIESFKKADLVVCSGGGYITDAFESKVNTTLGILSLAIKLGKPTVMFGQGLGPLKKTTLYTKAKAVLPHVNLIALREKRSSVPLLNSLGVSSNCFTVTGDDAIELAYAVRGSELGDGIGVNLRTADYANVSAESITTVKLVLQNIARDRSIPLIPIPIEFIEPHADTKAIQQILEGYEIDSDGGQSLNTPLEVAKQASRCRVVVTGSYHAGVFALSQGVPIVGLAKSEYYKDKFLGLADQFGTGCEVVFLDDNQLQEKLTTAIEYALSSSEIIRPKLLEAAQQQIDLGHTAYQRMYELVTKVSTQTKS
ncbi:MAG: polysaccharide pyruvyl transferase family protein [Cyanobacteria bacterium CRU_2_1]|nr:polysaccharide pyruvyl transferase family protein [Cyanobacteria bacterium CRU_2_1]